ncbi:MAG TPA: sensor histidine kinase [Pseudonocardiaceae bacterium]|jgi:anti-sigma regulatory factor (Ser/Thr protein kinase)|nr:sensor histidine kinase [Pseudonocardiaceae bacterium]
MGKAADATFGHPALFYHGDGEYLAGTVPFITDGLAAGDPVAVAVPGPHVALLRSALGSAAERVRLLDMTVVGRNPGRIIPGVLRDFADRYPDRHVRIIGEPIWPSRTAAEYRACLRHEALINHAFASRQVTVLCPYDADGLSRQVLADAARTHPVLVDHDGRHDSGQYEPDAVLVDCNQPLRAPRGCERFVVGPAGLAGLRRVVAAFGQRQGLTADRAEDLVLVLTELATNSVEHAGSPATILLGRTADRVVCQVHDTGYISDPLAGRRPAVPDQRRGRGLLLVNHLSDLVRGHSLPGATVTEVQFVIG